MYIVCFNSLSISISDLIIRKVEFSKGQKLIRSKNGCTYLFLLKGLEALWIWISGQKYDQITTNFHEYFLIRLISLNIFEYFKEDSLKSRASNPLLLLECEKRYLSSNFNIRPLNHSAFYVFMKIWLLFFQYSALSDFLWFQPFVTWVFRSEPQYSQCFFRDSLGGYIGAKKQIYIWKIWQ